MSKEQPAILPRPENRGIGDRKTGSEAWEVNPELMQLRIADLMIQKMGTPSIQEKEFAVRYGIWNALNHSPDNPTGYDCSLRCKIYREYAAQSINKDGVYFHNFWAWLNKPKFVIQGNNGIFGPQQEEPKKSIFGRIVDRLRGRGGNEQPNSSQ